MIPIVSLSIRSTTVNSKIRSDGKYENSLRTHDCLQTNNRTLKNRGPLKFETTLLIIIRLGDIIILCVCDNSYRNKYDNNNNNNTVGEGRQPRQTNTADDADAESSSALLDTTIL